MVLLCTTLSARADVLIYNQPSTFPVSGGLTSVWASQNDTGGGFGHYATAYANFNLSGSGTVPISSIAFQGGYFLPPGQGPITAFNVQFYSNVNNAPGALLASYSIPGNANETLAGLEASASNPSLIFNYNTSLPTSFDAQAGTQYWLAIFPDLSLADLNVGQWGWHTGITAPGGLGFSVQDFLGQRFTNPDLAFQLFTPAEIPEPTSLLVWGAFGVAGLAGYRFRKNRATA